MAELSRFSRERQSISDSYYQPVEWVCSTLFPPQMSESSRGRLSLSFPGADEISLYLTIYIFLVKYQISRVRQWIDVKGIHSSASR
jgi:hypothetical protein